MRDRGLAEFTVQPAFSPQSFLSEAMATVAAEVAFPWRAARLRTRPAIPAGRPGRQPSRTLSPHERLVDELQLAQVPIARLYLDGDLDFVRAALALEEQALMVHSEATLKYLNEYRTYMLCYTLGRHWLETSLGGPAHPQNPDQDRWQRYRGMDRLAAFFRNPESALPSRCRPIMKVRGAVGWSQNLRRIDRLSFDCAVSPAPPRK